MDCPSVTKVTFLALASILFIYTEYASSKLHKIQSIVKNQAEKLTSRSYLPGNHQNFVHIRNSEVNYEIFDDYLFHISRRAAIFERKIEYCQYVHEGYSSNGALDRQELFSTQWVDRPIHSSPTAPAAFRNPEQEFISSKRVAQDVYFGNLTIKRSIFDDVVADTVIIPDTTEIKYLKQPLKDSHFTYLSDGWFYSANGYSAKKRYQKYLDKPRSPPVSFHIYIGGDFAFIMEMLTQFILNKVNREPKNQALNELFDNCKAGDVRLQFLIYKPSKLSLVGFLNGSQIDAVDINGSRVGFVSEGDVALEKLLSHGTETDKIISYAAKTFCITLFILSIHKSSPSYLRKASACAICAISVLFLRSIMWNQGFLSLRIWGTAIAVLLPLYMKYVRNII